MSGSAFKSSSYTPAAFSVSPLSRYNSDRIPRKEYSSTEQGKIAQQTKVGGRSFSQVKNPELVIHKIIEEGKGILEKHYDIDAKGDSEILLEELGKRNGFFKKKGVVDEDKTARFIIKEWQEGKIKI